MTEPPPAEVAESRQVVRGLLLLVAFSFLIRCVWWALVPAVIEEEGCHYARLGESIAAGRGLLGLDENGFQLIYPPAYPGIIAAGIKLGMNSEFAGRLTSLLLGSLTPLLAALLALRLRGSKTCWAVGIIAACHPLLIVASGAVLSDASYLTLALATIFGAIRVMDLGSVRAAIFMGAMAGIAYLMRPEALILHVTLCGIIVLVNRSEWRLALRRTLVALGVFAVFALPYVSFLYQQTGQLRFEAKTAQGVIYQAGEAQGKIWGELYWGVDENLVEHGISNTSDLSQLQMPAEPLGKRLKIVVGQAVRNLPELFLGLSAVQFGQPFIGLLIGLGLFATPWTWARFKGESPLLLLCVLITGPFLIWPFILDRSLFVLMGPILVWAGAGLMSFRAWALETLASTQLAARWAARVVSAVLVVLVASIGVASATSVRESDEMSQSWQPALIQNRDIANWLREQGVAGLKIVDSVRGAAYYSKAVELRLPWCDSATAVRYIARARPHFVILREMHAELRPYLGEWLKEVPDKRLVLAKTFEGPAGKTLIYRWDEGTQ